MREGIVNLCLMKSRPILVQVLPDTVPVWIQSGDLAYLECNECGNRKIGYGTKCSECGVTFTKIKDTVTGEVKEIDSNRATDNPNTNESSDIQPTRDEALKRYIERNGVALHMEPLRGIQKDNTSHQDT